MCSYNIILNDQLINEVKPSFPNEKAFTSWLQKQVESILLKFKTDHSQIVMDDARRSIAEMRRQSMLNGNSGLSMDEIDEEIRLSRCNPPIQRKVA